MTGTWTTAYLAALAGPGETLPFIPPSRAFGGQTVRQAVRLRRGGSAVRVVLSNEFGRTPLVIDEVTVGAPGPGQVRPARRGQAARWEIPAGQTATSDPVPLATAAGDELVISCFVAGRAGPATYLHSAQRAGEVAPGHQPGRRPLAGGESFTSLYWIARVLVDAPPAGPVIVALGDSITRGDATTTDRDQRYPDHLQRRLLAAGAGGAVVLNAGLGGNRLLRAGVGPSVSDRFGRDVLGVAEATHVLILAGLNDIALPAVLGEPRPAADDIAAGLMALAARAAQHGISPVLGTITPVGGSRHESFAADGSDDLRRSVNHAVRTQEHWPVADFAAALAEPGDPARLAAALDSGDGLHPGDAGARALADAVDLSVFA
jgi:lysophospholipase L1-like esterase